MASEDIAEHKTYVKCLLIVARKSQVKGPVKHRAWRG